MSITQALGTPLEFQYRGKTYKISLISGDMKAQWASVSLRKAIATAEEMRPHLSPGDYQKLLKDINNEHRQGQYDLESETGFQLMATIPGQVQLLSILTGLEEKDVVVMFLEKGQELAEIMQTIFYQSFPQVKERLDKKKASSPNSATSPPIETPSTPVS